MDLDLFQFDYEQTWAVFFMNPDKTIYGRYGSESSFGNSGTNNSLVGFKKALEGALEIHAGYPGNKDSLAGKTGAPAAWKTPELLPFLQGKPPSKAPYAGKGTGCIHCHAAGGGMVKSLQQTGKPVPAKLQNPYPVPQAVGLTLDPNEKATVSSVAPGSAAEKAGFKAGDRISTLHGQPIVSIADVQWVLHNAPDSGTLAAAVDRKGTAVDVSLALAAGWRAAKAN